MKNPLHGIPFRKKIPMRMNQKVEKGGSPRDGERYLKISNRKLNGKTPCHSFYGREFFYRKIDADERCLYSLFKDKFCVARCDYCKLSQNEKLGLDFFFQKRLTLQLLYQVNCIHIGILDVFLSILNFIIQLILKTESQFLLFSMI